MAGRKSDFTLTKLDDLFSTQEQRDEEKLSKIRDIPLTEIDDFPDHPFKVRDDEDMAQLIESIKERGVITPATVRQKEDGRYELISGHRRKRACELAGFDTLRCEVVELNRDEATILMVESNYQRSQILPSEKAYAYKMRLEALSRQGKRTDLTSDPVGWKSSGKETAQLIGEQSGDSQTQVRRYRKYTDEASHFAITTPKTKSGVRIIPMLSDVKAALTEEYKEQLESGFNESVVDGYSGFIFKSRYNTVLSPHCVNRAIDRIIKACNAKEKEEAKAEGREPELLPHFSCHHLRHTFCTRFCENETNLKVIQEIMGHADITTTMDIYNEATKDKKMESFAGLEGKIKIR